MMRFPRWLSWIVLLGLGWILYIGNTRAPAPIPATPETPAAPAAAAPKTYKEINALLDGDRWKKAIYPDYQSPDAPCRATAPKEGMLDNYAILLTAGAGEGARCGDTIELVVTRRNGNGTAQQPTEAQLVLGEQPGLDPLLMDLRPGEQRLLILNLPAKLSALPALPANTQLLLNVERR